MDTFKRFVVTVSGLGRTHVVNSFDTKTNCKKYIEREKKVLEARGMNPSGIFCIFTREQWRRKVRVTHAPR